jgi:hypothetical protein
MTQPVGFTVGALDIGTMTFNRRFANPPVVPKTRHRCGVLLDPPIGVEQRAMRRGIDEGALIMLAVDFDQCGAKRAEHLNADRLIVDEGAGPAVGKLNPPDDQFVLTTKIVFGKHAARRMFFRQLESGGHLALLHALADQRRFATRAQRERKGIEQDRLSRAGLACQCGEPGAEIDI